MIKPVTLPPYAGTDGDGPLEIHYHPTHLLASWNATKKVNVVRHAQKQRQGPFCITLHPQGDLEDEIPCLGEGKLIVAPGTGTDCHKLNGVVGDPCRPGVRQVTTRLKAHPDIIRASSDLKTTPIT